MTARVTQQVIAALSLTDLAYTCASQIGVHVIGPQVATVRANQLGVQVIGPQVALIEAAHICLEILVWNHEVNMPAIYPTLPGLTFSVIKRPKWFTGIATSSSGREVRVAYAQNPLWEWDLSYGYLPDEPTGSAATPSDLKQLLGFYLSQQGSFGGFLFKDPDDHVVSGQVIGTTDGLTTNWTLSRTYGGSDGTGTEPVGYVDETAAFNVYEDGALISPSLYQILTTQPVAQVLKFNTAPVAGKIISVDMTFFYYCRFKDDHNDFEKFMDKLWQLQTVTLMSQRG